MHIRFKISNNFTSTFTIYFFPTSSIVIICELILPNFKFCNYMRVNSWWSLLYFSQLDCQNAQYELVHILGIPDAKSENTVDSLNSLYGMLCFLLFYFDFGNNPYCMKFVFSLSQVVICYPVLMSPWISEPYSAWNLDTAFVPFAPQVIISFGCWYWYQAEKSENSIPQNSVSSSHTTLNMEVQNR